MSALLVSQSATANPLSIQPWLAFSVGYFSNPYLYSVGGSQVSDVALLVNLPLNYDVDAVHFAFTPAIRYTDSGTFAALDSNYVHLNSSLQESTDRGSVTVTGAFARDSSLYHDGVSLNGVGVRTDSSSLGLDWLRIISPRYQFEFGAGWTRTLFGSGAGTTNLVDYRYLSAAPSIAYSIDERDTGRFTLSGGRYQALDGFTESRSYSAQLGLDRRLTEIWTLSAGLGYAVSKNRLKEYVGPIFLGNLDFQQKGPVYSLSLRRQGEKLSFVANGSRALTPYGVAYLSRQDASALAISYAFSERLSLTETTTFQISHDPVTQNEFLIRHNTTENLAVAWKWTSDWTVSLNASYVNQKYQVPAITSESTGVSLQVARQFRRIDL
jgi:hypothetical protein